MPESRAAIIKAIFENTNAIKRGMYSQLQIANLDSPVSGTQLELLYTIRHLQPISFKKLAQQLYLTAGAVSQLADSLAKHQLISRQVDPGDRRIQSLSLTLKGEKVLANVEKQRQIIMTEIMEDLTTAELLAWANVQQKLITRLQSKTTINKRQGD